MEKKLNKREALTQWNKWLESNYALEVLSTQEEEFRKKLENIHKKHALLITKKKLFEYDVEYGISLHKLLSSLRLDSLRVMSDDGFWRYISIIVAPHIVAHRHPNKPEYYFKKPSRVWFKSIWWLIYLTWQGDYETTKSLLLSGKFTTDTTVAICERTGLEGTNVDLYRAIIRKAGTISNFGMEELRRVMKLNTVKSLVVEPSLFEGGVDGYVEGLYKDLNIK